MAQVIEGLPNMHEALSNIRKLNKSNNKLPK